MSSFLGKAAQLRQESSISQLMNVAVFWDLARSVWISRGSVATSGSNAISDPPHSTINLVPLVLNVGAVRRRDAVPLNAPEGGENLIQYVGVV
jgi:hypothetical protein